MPEAELKSSPSSPDGPLTLIIAALVSSYIASERPEGDTLGWWAEIVQALCFIAFGVAAAVILFGLVLAAAGAARR